MTAHPCIVLLILCIFILALGFFFTIKHGKAFLEVIELHAKLTTYGHKSTKTVNIVLVFFVDLFVDFQGFVKEIHASVAASNHKLPLDFLRLDLRRSFEILNRLLEHVLFCVMHAQTRDHINFGWVVPETLLVEMNCLELVLFLLVEVAHFGEDFRVARNFSYQDVVPLESFSSHSDQFIDVGNLIQHLVAIGNNSMQLFKSLQRLIVIPQALVDKTKVVDCLDTVSFNTDSLKEEFLGAVEFFVNKECVALVDERLGVVSIVLDGQIGEMLGVFEVIFKEIQERDVV